MRRIVAIAVTATVMVLVAASPASAKGANQAIITGPGLAKPLLVGGNGEPGSGDDLARLSESSGFFVATFGGQPALTQQPPNGSLGPKYEVAYRVPDGTATGATVWQDLYPFAAGGPVTYTKPGQQLYGTPAQTGWYRAPNALREVVVKLGVPPTRVPDAVTTSQPAGVVAIAATPDAAPVRAAPSGWTRATMVLAGFALLGAAITVVLMRRTAAARR